MTIIFNSENKDGVGSSQLDALGVSGDGLGTPLAMVQVKLLGKKLSPKTKRFSVGKIHSELRRSEVNRIGYCVQRLSRWFIVWKVVVSSSSIVEATAWEGLPDDSEYDFAECETVHAGILAETQDTDICEVNFYYKLTPGPVHGIDMFSDGSVGVYNDSIAYTSERPHQRLSLIPMRSTVMRSRVDRLRSSQRVQESQTFSGQNSCFPEGPIRKKRIVRNKKRSYHAWLQRQRQSRQQRRINKQIDALTTIFPSARTAKQPKVAKGKKSLPTIDDLDMADAYQAREEQEWCRKMVGVDSDDSTTAAQQGSTDRIVNEAYTKPKNFTFTDDSVGSGGPASSGLKTMESDGGAKLVDAALKVHEQLKEASKLAGPTVSNQIGEKMYVIERLVIFGIRLANATSIYALLFDTFDFIHAQTGKSWISEINSVLNPDSYHPSGMVDTVAAISRNTNLMTVVKAVTMATSIVMAGFTNVTWDLELFKGVDFGNIKLTDMISLVIDSIEWFTNTGYEVFRTGSLAPLTWASPEYGKLMTRYEKVRSDYDKAVNATGSVDFRVLLDDLEKVHAEITTFVAQTKCKSTRGTVLRYGSKIHELILDIYGRIDAQSMRIEPYGVSLHGASSVGKSNLIAYISRAICAGYGEQYEKERSWIVGAGNKYDDGLTNGTQTVVIDDMGNIRPEFVDTPPTDRIIRFVNTTKIIANMADVESKGKIHPAPSAVVVTTNVKTLNAKQYSMEPASILRRLLHIEVVVNSDFRNKGATSLNTNHPLLGQIDVDGFPKHDIHSFRVQKYIVKADTTSGFTTVFYNDVCPEDSLTQDPNGWVNLRQLHKMLYKLAKEKYLKQIDKMSTDNDLPPVNLLDGSISIARPPPDNDEMSFLSSMEDEEAEQDCNVKPVMNLWAVPMVLAGPGDIYPMFMAKLGDMMLNYFKFHIVPFFLQNVVNETTSDWAGIVADVAQEAIHDGANLTMHWLPRRFFVKPDGEYTAIGRVIFTKASAVFYKQLYDTLRNMVYQVFVVALIRFLWFYFCVTEGFPDFNSFNWVLDYFGVFVFPLLVLLAIDVNYILARAREHNKLKDEIREKMLTRPAELTQIMTERRTHVLEYTTAGVAVGVAIVAVLKIWQITYAPSASSSGMSWLGSIPMSFMSPKPSLTAVPSKHLDPVIGKNMVHVGYTQDGGSYSCVTGYLITSSHLLTVGHVFTRRTGRGGPLDYQKFGGFVPGNIAIRRAYGRAKNVCEERINVNKIKRIGSQDLVIVHLDRCFPVADRQKIFAQSALTGGSHALTYYTLTGDNSETCSNFDVTCKYSDVGYDGARTKGLETRIDYNLVDFGHCGSVVVSKGNSCAIQGVLFAAGSTGVGHFELVDYPRIRAVLDDFETELCTQRADLADVTDAYGIKTVVGNVHASARLAFNDVNEGVVHAIGQTQQRMDPRSEIFESKIAHDIYDVFCTNKDFGPPKFKGEFEIGGEMVKVNPSTAYNTAAQHLVQGANNVKQQFLDHAGRDYFRKVSVLATKGRPLTLDETVNGVFGSDHITRMDMSTSMGFPLFKKKTDYFSLEDGKYVCGDEVLKEFNRVHELAKSGKRTNPVFAAMLKDEPVPVHKYKVRVFYACPVAFTMLTRMYFLPIIEDLLRSHKTSEIAVGMVCSSRQWQQVMRHAKRFMTGDKQVFGYDYSKYDLKFSPNVLRKAYELLIEFARIKGYSEEQLKVMRVIAKDMANPFISWNGTLLSTSSLHPSGNVLTTIVNSIVNVLLVRSYFYEYSMVNPEQAFSDFVGLISYGDDGLGSIKNEIRDNINFTGYQKWLETINMKATHPKKDGSTDFSEGEMDFLKRIDVYHSQLGYTVGALEEASILKSLYCRRRVKEFDHHSVPTGLTEEIVTSQAMDCALHEWFLHGPDVYEDRRQKLLKVLKKHPAISNSTVSLTYEQRAIMKQRDDREGQIRKDALMIENDDACDNS